MIESIITAQRLRTTDIAKTIVNSVDHIARLLVGASARGKSGASQRNNVEWLIRVSFILRLFLVHDRK